MLQAAGQGWGCLQCPCAFPSLGFQKTCGPELSRGQVKSRAGTPGSQARGNDLHGREVCQCPAAAPSGEAGLISPGPCCLGGREGGECAGGWYVSVCVQQTVASGGGRVEGRDRRSSWFSRWPGELWGGPGCLPAQHNGTLQPQAGQGRRECLSQMLSGHPGVSRELVLDPSGPDTHVPSTEGPVSALHGPPSTWPVRILM